MRRKRKKTEEQETPVTQEAPKKETSKKDAPAKPSVRVKKEEKPTEKRTSRTASSERKQTTSSRSSTRASRSDAPYKSRSPRGDTRRSEPKREYAERKPRKEYIVDENIEITFLDGLKPALQQAVNKLGYTQPTQIQQEVRNAFKSGNNIVGQSQTGTGKTTAFLLPLLQNIDNKNRFPQVLIVAPTRELVQQIRLDIMDLTAFLPMRSMILIGGKSMHFQKEDLKYGPQFIVATPGRLIEFIQSKFLDVSNINYFVLDEVDRMLDMGFIEDVDWIWSQLDNLKQTMTFSATLAQEVKDVIKKHCIDYTDIRVGERITVDKIDHAQVPVNHEHKFATLVDILDKYKGKKTLIFSQTKRNTEALAKELQQEKIDGKKLAVQYLNGDLDMRHRTRTLRDFKGGFCNILITTDVAARGLNMDNVELVINFDVPREAESYVHRIGRTGRAGADGKALTLVDPDERHLIMEIEKIQKVKIKQDTTIKAITDKQDLYFDVNLDRPLPPSDKKRRMVARSIARDRGEVSYRTGRFGGRTGRGSYKKQDSGYSRSSSRYGERKERFEKKPFEKRSYDRKSTEKTTDRNPSSGRGNRFTRQDDFARTSGERRKPISRSQFDNKPERYSRKTERNTYKKNTSIGGYDLAFFSEQRRQEQEKFIKRTPKANDRKANERPTRGKRR